MNLSVKLITALAAFVLLVVGLVGLTSSGSTANAADVDGKVYVANEWSNLTNDPTPLSGYTYAGSGKTIYGTFVEVNDATGVEQSTIAGTGNDNANRVTIFVEDADVNKSVSKSTTLTSVTMNGAGVTQVVVLLTADSPIVDTGTAGILDGTDITITGTEATRVALAGAVSGSKTVPATITLVQVGSTSPSGGVGTVVLNWKTSAVDTLVVKVTSTQNTTGKTFTINETAASSGVFKGSIDLIDVARDSTPASDDNTTVTDNATGGTIAIQNGSQLTVEYSDSTPATGTTAKKFTSTLTAETGAPVVAITAPAHDSATQVRRPTFAGSVNDTTSGLDVSSIAVHVDDEADSTNSTPVAAGKGDSEDTNSPTLPTGTADGTTSTTFSYPSSKDLPVFSGSPDHKVDWQVQAIDLAGNIGWSDAKTSGTNSANVDTTKGSTGIGQNGRGQAHVVKIDQTLPGINNVYSGFSLDTTGSTTVRKVNNTKSIEVEFNDNIDGSTIVNTDFEVVVGSVTQVPNDAVVGGTGFLDRVFLTLDGDLATKDKPTVKIVGSIADAAGNTTSTGSKAGVDAIAPTLTVALSGGSSATSPATLTKDKITITITSDEALASDPTVDIYDEADAVTKESSVTAVNQGSNTWIATFSKGSSHGGDSSNPDGFKKSILVTANDSATLTNAGLSSGTTVPSGVTIGEATKGKKDDAASGAVLFTLDTFTPQLTLAPSSDTSENSPFIRWNFKEVVTVSKAEFGLSSATVLEDVTAELGTSDNKEFVRATSNLALGTYKATATVTDSAGNKATGLNDTFKVVKRSEFKLTVLPGTTLVSFPLTPSDTSISSVFSPAGIVSVSSYNAGAGTFSSAVRDAESGTLTGTLASVESGVGYVVVADAVSALVVPIPSLSASSIPPSIALVAGWNLVGVTDVTGNPSTGALRQAPTSLTTRGTYFPTKVTQVYDWDATAKVWKQVASGTNVLIGDAYWAFASAADVIVP